MEKVEVRAIIKYSLRRKYPKEIHEDFMETLGKDSPSYSTVKKGAAEFWRGKKSIEDDKLSGRSKEATTDENIEIMHCLVMCDRM